MHAVKTEGVSPLLIHPFLFCNGNYLSCVLVNFIGAVDLI